MSITCLLLQEGVTQASGMQACAAHHPLVTSIAALQAGEPHADETCAYITFLKQYRQAFGRVGLAMTPQYVLTAVATARVSQMRQAWRTLLPCTQSPGCPECAS